LKGVYGQQRYFWDKGPGIVRGADADFNINDLFKVLENSKLRIRLGGSFVSKYEADEEIYTIKNDKLILPLNVGAGAGRANLSYGNFDLNAEYARKINDPNAQNSNIYRKGESLLLTASYNKKGLGVIVQAKRLDNMGFKSKRSETASVLDINYLPAITRQHTYTLAALYPYATQVNSEMGFETQVNYKIPKHTFLGGKYGTDIAVNFSAINSIYKDKVNDTIAIDEPGTLGYTSPFFKIGKTKYFRDFNVEIGHKFSSKFKMIFTYMYENYNMEIIENHGGMPIVEAHICIADMSYKLSSRKALRLETQLLSTKQDEGNWGLALLEYTVAPAWFISVTDQWNFGNEDPDRRFHYPLLAVAYNNDANRIQLSYGKQREGIVCVGGVCRAVPASNGFTLTITTSF
jgi:predicted porin